jgi:hypothetical protein
VTIRRKPRASANVRYLKKCGAQLTAYGIPLLRFTLTPLCFDHILSFPASEIDLNVAFTFLIPRYGIMPGLLFFSVYYTEPQPSFFELLNPFF